MIIALLALAWLLGLVAQAWSIPGGPAGAAVLAAALPAVTWRRGAVPVLLLGCASAGFALLGGACRQAADAPPPASSVAWLIDAGPVRLRGVVAGDPQERERSRRLRLDAREVLAAGERRTVTGGVLVRLPLASRVRSGDILEMDGHLVAPPRFEGFDYRTYLARQGIVAEVDYPRLREAGHESASAASEWLRRARRTASATLDRSLPQPEAALARGIIVGDRATIPSDVAEDFRRSGTSHLVAISGYNITLVAGLITGGLAWLLGRRHAALAALAAITLYSVFVGLSPSVARALLMGALVIGAGLLGRPGAPLVSLAVAAALMTAQDPHVLDDAGFQLSFAATAGILLLVAPLQGLGRRLLAGVGLPPLLAGVLAALADSLAVTLAATLATLPVILHTFGRLSLISPVANLVLVPLFPVVMVTSAAATLTGALLPAAGHAAGTLAEPPLALTIAGARFFAGMPGASAEIGRPSGTMAAAFALVVALATWLLARRRAAWQEPNDAGAPRLRISGAWTAVSLPLLLVGGVVAGRLIDGGKGDGRLTVAYADAGGAAVALITGPGGERVLVDTGATPAALQRALDPLLARGGRTLDMIVLTRWGPAAAGGLASAVERYRSQVVAAPPATEDADPLDMGAAVPVTLEPGSSIRLSAGARIVIEAARGDRQRLQAVAVLGRRRIAVTAGADAEAGATRAGSGATARTIVAAGLLPDLRYDVRTRGPVRLSTDGMDFRVQPARGGALPDAAEGQGREWERTGARIDTNEPQ